MRLICICNFVYRISNLRDFASRVGIAYRWLQRICGLQFLDNAPAASATSTEGDAPAVSDVSNDNNLEMTVRKIRRRVVTRVSLCRQLLAFGSILTSHLSPITSSDLSLTQSRDPSNCFRTTLGRHPKRLPTSFSDEDFGKSRFVAAQHLRGLCRKLPDCTIFSRYSIS